LGKADILVLFFITVFLAYLQLLHLSVASVKVIVEVVRFPELTDLLGFAATRRLRADLSLMVEDKGPLPVTLRSSTFDVYVEDAYVGKVTSRMVVEVKLGETHRARNLTKVLNPAGAGASLRPSRATSACA